MGGGIRSQKGDGEEPAGAERKGVEKAKGSDRERRVWEKNSVGDGKKKVCSRKSVQSEGGLGGSGSGWGRTKRIDLIHDK